MDAHSSTACSWGTPLYGALGAKLWRGRPARQPGTLCCPSNQRRAAAVAWHGCPRLLRERKRLARCILQPASDACGGAFQAPRPSQAVVLRGMDARCASCCLHSLHGCSCVAQQFAAMVLRYGAPPSPRMPAQTGCVGHVATHRSAVCTMPNQPGWACSAYLHCFFLPLHWPMPPERAQDQLQVGSQGSAGAALGSRLAEIG